MKILKTDDEQQLIFGVFYLNKIGDELVEDLQGDMWTTEEMEKTAYHFVLNARVQGENHVRKGVGRSVESVVLSYEKQQTIQKYLDAMGIEGKIDLGCEMWFAGFKIEKEDVWEKVKSGELPAFSIGGRGQRIPVEDEEE